MKKLIILILAGCFAKASFGQSNQSTINKVYAQLGLGACSYKGFSTEIGIQAILKNKWAVTLSRQSLQMDPKNLPSNYQPETGYVLFIPYAYTPEVEMNITSLTGGRFFKTGEKTWATLEAGPGLVNGDKFSFQGAQVTNTNVIIAASTSSNYNDNKENKSTVGLTLKADFNWAFSSVVGLGASAFANLNSIQSPIGFNARLIVGWMNRKSKHS